MEEFAIKVSPFDGSTAGELSEGRMRACGWGWYEPILVDLSPSSRERWRKRRRRWGEAQRCAPRNSCARHVNQPAGRCVPRHGSGRSSGLRRCGLTGYPNLLSSATMSYTRTTIPSKSERWRLPILHWYISTYIRNGAKSSTPSTLSGRYVGYLSHL